MLLVADLPKDLKEIGYQTLKHINCYTVISYYLTRIASYQVVRNLVLLFIITITSVLKVGFSSTLQASILLTNSNYNMPLVLEYNPPTYIVVGLSSYSSRHLATVLQPSLAMLNKVAQRVYLIIQRPAVCFLVVSKGPDIHYIHYYQLPRTFRQEAGNDLRRIKIS